MVFTDFGFSQVRDWLLKITVTAPSGALVGLGSTAATFADLLLGSPVDSTRGPLTSKDKVGTRAILEFVVESGDFILGSKFREVGMIQQSGANLMLRETTYAMVLDGSTEIQGLINIDVK